MAMKIMINGKDILDMNEKDLCKMCTQMIYVRDTVSENCEDEEVWDELFHASYRMGNYAIDNNYGCAFAEAFGKQKTYENMGGCNLGHEHRELIRATLAAIGIEIVEN